MLQLKKLITKTKFAKLYKAFILMHFQHYSSVWHFCGARNAENLENLIKGFLDLLGDLESTFNILLSEVNCVKGSLTLKMTTAQVVKTSVTVNNNSPIQDYVHLDDQTQPTFEVNCVSLYNRHSCTYTIC